MKMPPQGNENRNSSLLSTDENFQVFKLMGNRCLSICTTVAQLYTTDPPNHSQWIKRDVGVLCFVKDNTKKNYFFRLFCLRRNAIVWEQEMYNNIEYNASTSFLHVFEGEEAMVAFNFADINEATSFKECVDIKISTKRRRDEKKIKQMKVQQLQDAPLPKTPTNQYPTPAIDYKKNPDKALTAAKRKRNITKADIGSPLDFKHVSHVGWNPDHGFDINIQDEQYKGFFERAGISDKQLQDKDTKNFIYDFINRNGGIEALESSTNSQQFYNTNRRAPEVPCHASTAPVPPVPPRMPSRPHVRTAPPPPPPSHSKSPSISSSYTPEYERKAAAPPPPPPPPMMMTDGPIPPPPMPSFNETSSNSNSGSNNAPALPSMGAALLESIQKGTTLRPVDERERNNSSPVEDSRGLLLKEIRGGMKLKPVAERDVKPANNINTENRGCDLAVALARALADRNKAIHSEDDDDESDSNDDEWED